MKNLLLSALVLAALAAPVAADSIPSVERCGVFEMTLEGPREGNPYVNVQPSAEFTNGEVTVRVTGFYDGEGVYRVRFMPGRLGEWTYRTESNAPALGGQTGSFTCTPATAGNHEIRVEFFERAGGQALEVVWSSPSIDPQPILAERLFHRAEQET